MVTDADTDSDAVAAQLPIKPPVGILRVDEIAAAHRPRAAAAGHCRLAAGRRALKRVCRQLFGADCTQHDETRFLIFAAPIARKIAIGLANRGDRIGDSEVKVQDLVEWLGWLDRFDPMCAAMIDLHYFAGLTTKQTAAALRLPPEVVDPRPALRQGLAANEADLRPAVAGARSFPLRALIAVRRKPDPDR